MSSVPTITDVRAHMVRSPRMIDDILRDETVVVEITTDAGISGWAEACGLPAALKAIIETERPHPNDRGARPALIGQPVSGFAELIASLRLLTFRTGRVGLGRIAVGAIETALIDLFGKVEQVPAWRILLDGAPEPAQPTIRPYISIYHPAPFENIIAGSKDDIDRGIAAGYRSFKLEATGYNTPGGEAIQYAELMREHAPDDIDLIVDTTYRYRDYDEAREVARAYHDLGVTFLEDPFPNDLFDLWRRLSEEVGLPLATGGGLTAIGQFIAAADLGGARILQPGVHTAGLLGAHEIAQYMAGREGSITPFAYCATTLATAATVHLAAANPNVPVMEYAPAELFPDALLRADIAGPEPTLVDGVFEAPALPGLGVTCDVEALERYRITA